MKNLYYIANHKNTKFLASRAADLSSVTDEFNNALIFTNDKEPQKIIKLLPKSIKRYYTFEVHKFKEDMCVTKTQLQPTVKKDDSIELPQSKTEVSIENKGTVSYTSLKNELNNLAPKLNEILNDQKKLNNELSSIDLKISDILHYIEFHKFSASEGYKLAKMIQEVRDQRRIIKDKLKVIEILKTSTCTGISTGDIVNRIDALEDRTYIPRVYFDLFEQGKNKKREGICS